MVSSLSLFLFLESHCIPVVVVHEPGDVKINKIFHILIFFLWADQFNAEANFKILVLVPVVFDDLL